MKVEVCDQCDEMKTKKAFERGFLYIYDPNALKSVVIKVA